MSQRIFIDVFPLTLLFACRRRTSVRAPQAMCALVRADRIDSGGGLRTWSEALLPALLQLTNDRTPAVRQELARLVRHAWTLCNVFKSCGHGCILIICACGASRFSM